MKSQASLVSANRDTSGVPAIDGLRNSPTRRFPSEIISEIFLHCLPAKIYPRPSACEAPLVLGRICRLWRRVALSTPRLWAKIRIEPMNRLRHFENNVCALEEWILRSGSRPLSIKLEVWSTPVAEQLIELILQNFKRWESLDIKAFKSSIAPVMAAIQRGAPMLRSLRIVIHLIISWGITAETVELSSLPQLRRLEMQSELYVPHFVNIQYNIRYLQLNECVSINECFRCLELCPLVESFGVAFHARRNHPSSNTPRMLEHSHLHNLRVSTHRTFIHISNDDPGLFLDMLQLPNLESLTLDTKFNPIPESWPHLSALLQRSKPRLKRLEIITAPFGEETILECLQYTPHLESLAVGRVLITSMTMTALTCPPDVNPNDDVTYLCPRLKRVAVFKLCQSVYNRIPGRRINSLMQMILCRWDPSEIGSAQNRPANLRSIEVRQHDYDILSKTPEMEKCIEEGFKVVLEQIEEEEG